MFTCLFYEGDVSLNFVVVAGDSKHVGNFAVLLAGFNFPLFVAGVRV